LFAVYFWAERRTLAAGLAAVLLIFPQPSFQWTDTEDLTLLGQREGYYQTIRVYESEEENFVQMHLGPTFQSKMDLETGEPLFSYAQRIVELIDEDMLDGQRALVIGGAGHVMSRYLAEHGAEVVEVEIDPLVVDFSTRFFGAVDAEIVIQDGRIYLETVEPDRFDLILIDAFDGAATVPPQLTTLEFFEAVDRALTSDGLMVYNFIGTPEGARSRSYHAMSRTVREALDHVGVTGTTEPTVDGERSRNILFFASPQPLDAYDLQAPPEDGFLLTDDRNPMDVFLMESRGWHYFRR
jgi:spermidine synthase